VLLHRQCAGMLSSFLLLHLLEGSLQCLGKAQSDGVGKLTACILGLHPAACKGGGSVRGFVVLQLTCVVQNHMSMPCKGGLWVTF
jgi:hypothetical protein